MNRLDHARILIYSHDSFGLGHLRRCRAISHALVERYKGLTVLILSGSPIIASFEFRARVDFVRVPGVIKLHNGDYTSLALHIDLEETLAIRQSIIKSTAQEFAPDLFLVDKEPLGLRGEVQSTLELLKNKGCRCVLGMRDIMDEPKALRAEWRRKKAMPALHYLYDEVWIYGHKRISDPLADLGADRSVYQKATFTGYIRRQIPHDGPSPTVLNTQIPYVLVTTGGGGDGYYLTNMVISALEQEVKYPFHVVMVFGPFMPHQDQQAFMDRVAALPFVTAITFDSRIDYLIAHASAVVAMGGHNTFCEILSFDKPALIIPRKEPRLEQWIRASSARDLGLLQMIDPDDEADLSHLVNALINLPEQPPPSSAEIAGLLSGLPVIEKRVGDVLSSEKRW